MATPLHFALSRLHRQRRGYPSPPRRRAVDPNPRRRKDDRRSVVWIGSALLLALAALLAYSLSNFRYLATTADSYLNGVASSAHANNLHLLPMAIALLPVLGLTMGTALLAVPHGLGFRAARSSDNVMDLDRFRELAAERGIRTCVASHAFALLRPHFHRSMRARLSDHLQEDLRLTETEIFELTSALLRNTDRRPKPGILYENTTVLDLLRSVQDAPRSYHPGAGAA